MKFILGRKLDMSQSWNTKGKVVPVTRVEAGPCTVIGMRTSERDGYMAVQVGFGVRKHVSKPLKGLFQDKGAFQYVREFRVASLEGFEMGMKIEAGNFVPGDAVVVTGVSKGKGFQGVVKRHHFAGHPASHGHKDQLRMPGAIGVGDASHVFKGKRMGGRMGTDRVTVKGLEIVSVDQKKNILNIKGAIPGARNGLVMIQGIKK